MRKYLEEIGISESQTCAPMTTADDDSRMPRFIKQREEYGFDERETWALNFTFACWLYEHLRMYLEVGGQMVNLSYHHFDIPVLNEDNTEAIENHTQEECIALCCQYLENYLKLENDVDMCESADRNLKAAIKIFAEISPAMWW
jgi:hypothetical protein